MSALAFFAPPHSPRSAQLHKLTQENQTLQARAALTTFLHQVHTLQEDMRKEAGSAHPQPYHVFLSYAWGAEGDSRFEDLRRLLRAFYQDLTEPGLTVWFDEKHMVGDVNAQMREGVASSDLVLLFGTEVYRSKTQADSKTNVKKELDFALEQHKAKPGFLIPLLLEGKAKDIFSAPGLGYSQIIVDATQWSGLDQEQYSTRPYIHALTTFQNSVGILPAALGLPQADRRYRSRYETCEEALHAKLDKIYAIPVHKEDGSATRKETDVPINPLKGVNPMHDFPYEVRINSTKETVTPIQVPPGHEIIGWKTEVTEGSRDDVEYSLGAVQGKVEVERDNKSKGGAALNLKAGEFVDFGASGKISKENHYHSGINNDNYTLSLKAKSIEHGKWPNRHINPCTLTVTVTTQMKKEAAAAPKQEEEKQEHAPSFAPLPAAQLLPPVAAAPAVSPDLAPLQQKLAEKEAELEKLNKRTGGRAKLDVKIAKKQKELQDPDIMEDDKEEAQKALEKARKDKADLDTLESQHRTLKKQIAALTAADSAESTYSHSAVGQNSKAVHIEGNAGDLVLSSEASSNEDTSTAAVLPKGGKADHSALGKNSKAVHIGGNAGNLSL